MATNKNYSNNQITGQAASQSDTAVVNSYTNAQTQTGGTQSSAQGAKSVIGVFGSRSDAEQAVRALRSQGFTTEEISIVSKNKQEENRDYHDTEYFEDDITDGALTGGTLGGIGGLLLGAGALAIPGVGPILAAGPIAAALSGAVAGGIAGGLIDWGIPAEAGKRYEQEVVKGRTLAIIRSDAAKINQAAQILRQNGATDVETHTIK
ncbi:hypothetical protein SCACP_16750 [Sporomusa carbonis]|uniref:general stress protein n=1 Tax=Sporomusa carbonis TaxID=3076075 RepID=UPI003A6F1582